jgi:hypothetical protein
MVVGLLLSLPGYSLSPLSAGILIHRSIKNRLDQVSALAVLWLGIIPVAVLGSDWSLTLQTSVEVEAKHSSSMPV